MKRRFLDNDEIEFSDDGGNLLFVAHRLRPSGYTIRDWPHAVGWITRAPEFHSRKALNLVARAIEQHMIDTGH